MSEVIVIERNIVTVIEVGIQGARGPRGLAAPILMTNYFFQNAANLVIPICISSRYRFTIDGLYGYKAASGTILTAVQINGVDVTGLSALAATSTARDILSTDTNVVNIGDRVTLVFSGNTLAAGLEFTLGGTIIPA